MYEELFQKWLVEKRAEGFFFSGIEIELFGGFSIWLDARAKREREWRDKYENRLIQNGYIRLDAHESADAAEFDDDLDPIEAADEETSYAISS